MLTPDEIATIRTRCEKTVLRCSYEAAGTGRHNDYKRDVSALLAHIQAQSEQLRQAQAEGAILREALKGTLELIDVDSLTTQTIYRDWRRLLSRSTLAITAYAAKVARMEEALKTIEQGSPPDDWQPLDDWGEPCGYPGMVEGADLGNWNDVHNHGCDVGRWDAARIARAALKEVGDGV